MLVVGVMEFGGPDALAVHEVPEPHAGPGEVRIRVRAATVNPTDTGFRAGRSAAALEGRTPPYVPGMEAAGRVDEVGAGATYQVGDDVMAILLPTGPHGGAYAEHVVAPEASIAPIPQGVTMPQAATVPMNGLTAYAVLEELGLREGQTLAVTGAAGALGGYVVQLAKVAGLRVVADASFTDEELVHELGADVVVPRGEDVAERIRAVVPDGVDGLLDASLQTTQVVPAVADGGQMAVVRGWDGDPGRGITVHKIQVGRYAERQDLLDELRRDVQAGVLTPRVARMFPAAQAADAHRQLEAGGTRGRLVLLF
ncbi:MAG TPA: NADP-dependent oxidoreductase [Segeticoccus sp.]|uniref:quinone oxidoreductase family protein n=1 Tax=Segeticoccus sp. TaxID=2706531 RepID=UPI002D7FFB08|nr:NADP-dependent oxidoreductase [Segeticoccus sp.]HET8602164.1 NADP-dependent oxidoreductase [Segeticoccus sp.]